MGVTLQFESPSQGDLYVRVCAHVCLYVFMYRAGCSHCLSAGIGRRKYILHKASYPVLFGLCP